jgi:hypothetical protein
MLPETLVEEIRRQLAAGATQRAVARQLAVWRGTVSLIATGKRPNYEVARRERLSKGQAEREAARAQGQVPAARCPQCGVKAVQPCRACQTRAKLQEVGLKVRAARHRGERIRQLELELKPADQERYEEVRAEKIAADRQRLTPEGAQPDWAEAEFERAKALVERIRFVCPCGQLMRGILIWRPGKPELIRFQARARHLPHLWLDTVHCPCCQRDFSKVTPEQFRAEVMATSLPTGNGKENHECPLV